jgi:phosphoribosylformimino-5-aminoimidazole carboxamide ribotide isomerase
MANFNIVAQIKKDTGLSVQYGGGIRNHDALKRIMDAGIDRAIIGITATRNAFFVPCAVENYPGRIIVDVPARDGMVGWDKTKPATLEAVEFALSVERSGALSVLFTDTAQDGTQGGVNITATDKLARRLKTTSVIASGGIGRLDHIKAVRAAARQNPNITGLVWSTALFENKFTLQDALRIA